MFFEYYKSLNGNVTTAQTLLSCGFSQAEIEDADVLVLTPRDKNICYTLTSTLPSTTVGQIARADETISIYLNKNIRNFKMCAASDTAKWTILLGRIYGK